MRPIDADALLKKTINNPLHVPYITKKDVIDMPSALNNQVNLCDSCTYTYPECPSEKDDVIFGNGIGNDNICACNKYQPTVQPVATDTNVGDKISRQVVIDALHTWFRDGFDEDKWWNSTHVLAAIEGLHPVQQEHKWETCFECPLSHGCPKIKGCTNEQAIEYASQIPNDCPLSAQPEPHWIPVSERLPETEEFVLASLTGKYRNITFEHACEIADYADGEWCVYAYPHMSAEKCEELIEAWMPLPEAYKPNNK